MSMGLHRHWYKEVILQSKQIEEPLKRLEFLRNKRNKFRSENFGSIDSDIVVNALDDEIRDLQSDIILLHSIKPSASSELKGGNSIKPEAINQEETTVQKINRILEPLKELRVFDDSAHIDNIAQALIKFSDNADTPMLTPERKRLRANPKDFYPVFKQLKNETGLQVDKIALVLAYFVLSKNGSTLAQSTIRKNIYINY
jgi:hypothetical protein